MKIGRRAFPVIFVHVQWMCCVSINPGSSFGKRPGTGGRHSAISGGIGVCGVGCLGGRSARRGIGGGAANAAPGGDITAVCGASATPAPTYTLKTDCGPVTSAVTVPDTITTVNGAGHTISANATDASGGPYTGAVLTNLPGNHGTMNIENLTITGPTAGFTFTIPANTCSSYFPGLFGIFFNDDSGTATNVDIFNMFQTRTPTSPACVVGHSIRADGLTAPRTVNITRPTSATIREAACSPPAW